MSDQTLPGTEWVDCTNFLSNVCSNMGVGEMLHHPTKFSLMEVMSVIEMMDPKMDTSYKTPRVRSVTERFIDGTLPSFEQLSMKQVLYTMDMLISAELQWYDGLSLPQTVFTCLYLMDDLCYVGEPSPEKPKSNIFILFTKMLFKRIDYLIETISRVDCKTEEEFVNSSFGLFTIRSLEGTDNLQEDVQEMIQHIESNQQDYQGHAQDLIDRLLFQQAFFRSREAVLFVDQDILSDALTYTKSCKELFQLIKKSHADMFGNEQEQVDQSDGQQDDPTRINIAFDHKITTRLSSAAVIKAVKLAPLTKTAHILDSFLDHMIFICRGAQQLYGADLDHILRFFVSFSKLDHLNVVSRCTLMYIAIQNEQAFGTDMKQLVAQHIQSHLPMMNNNHQDILKSCLRMDPAPLQKTNKNVQDILDEEDAVLTCQQWVDLMCNVIFNYMNALCSNPANTRRKFSHLIIEWGMIEQKAEQLDLWCIEELRILKRTSSDFTISGHEHLFAFTYYCIEHTCALCQSYLLIGFELQLYHKTEIHHVLWYLDYICGLRSQNMTKMLQRLPTDQDLKMMQSQLAQLTPGGKKKKKNKIKNLPPVLTVPTETTPLQKIKKKLIEVDTYISRGLYRFALATLIGKNENGFENIFDDGTLPNMNPLLRFNKRFQCFHLISQPPPISYDQYKSYMEHSYKDATPSDLLNVASENLNYSRQVMEDVLLYHKMNQNELLDTHQLQSIKDMIKMIQANMISITLTSMKMNSKTNQSATFEFQLCPQYPVIKLTK
ncbi:N-alpha-acetyltransferase 35, NatC auxiliary subunit [Acrasis kona]|uniref:N-alpha-acetyltransferase 35, NatC auxiliary subunit n=1 Tax=Acrasis kona TaxID=1008807 RepID=A0AAW2Z2S6_9EUKA